MQYLLDSAVKQKYLQRRLYKLRLCFKNFTEERCCVRLFNRSRVFLVDVIIFSVKNK